MPPTQLPPQDEVRAPLALRVTLFVLGSVSLALGLVGVVLPLLPTTPFVLLAAGCYARAWPPAHRWLRANRFLGPIVRSGAEGRYLPARAKVIAVGLTVASFGTTIVLTSFAWPLKAALAVLGLTVSLWLARLPTEPHPATGQVQGSAREAEERSKR